MPKNNYEKIRYGCIDYHRFNDLEESGKIVVKEDTRGFVKDLSFQHEQEFRIMVKTQQIEKKKAERKSILDENVERLNERLDLKVIHLTFTDFKSLPFEVIFHPQSFHWHRENIVKIINKFELPFKTTESVLKDIFK